jgi:hypothetical protein
MAAKLTHDADGRRSESGADFNELDYIESALTGFVLWYERLRAIHPVCNFLLSQMGFAPGSSKKVAELGVRWWMWCSRHPGTVHPKVEYPISGYALPDGRMRDMTELTFDIPEGSNGQVIIRVVVDVEELARAISSQLAPDGLLDAAGVASILKCSPRYLSKDIALSPEFPKAIRFAGPDGRRSNARWQRRDIMEWIESQKTHPRRVGRPRRNV